MKKIRKKHIVIIIIVVLIASFFCWYAYKMRTFGPRYIDKSNFKKEEIKLLEEELNFKLSDKEYIDHGVYVYTRNELEIQLWIENISDYEKFITENLKMELSSFEPMEIVKYSEDGRNIYTRDIFGTKGCIDGWEYTMSEKSYSDPYYTIEIYPNEETGNYMVTIYKFNHINNWDIIKIFE